MDRFRGRIALVTGSSAGIGEAIARHLAVDYGMKVVGCARRKDKLEQVEERCEELERENCSGGRFYGYQCDLENDDDVRGMFQWIRDNPDLGHIDVCICNAGICTRETLTNASPDLFRKFWNLNVVSASFCAQQSVNLMIEKGVLDGQVIFINSLCGHKFFEERRMVVYNSTKLALTCIVQGWRREVQCLGENKIRIGQVSPGLVETEIVKASNPELKDFSNQMFSTYPHLQPDQIAYAVVTQMAAPPECQIRDTIIGHVHETW